MDTMMYTGAAVGVPPRGYRLPAATHLGMVRLQVSDLARSLAWPGTWRMARR